MIYLIAAVNLLLLTYLGWGAIYQLFYALAGHFYKRDKMQPTENLRRMIVFIPAYKEDSVIVQTARLTLVQDYPRDRYDVMVIADGLKESTLQTLRSLPIKVLEVQFEKSTKSKALNRALDTLEPDAYDAAIILDADNIAAPDFLKRINADMERGAVAVQGRRAAKNSHTGVAILDAASEDTNNHILCRGHQAVGLSARLAGSGMAFEYTLFRKVMRKVDAIGGFDKELELRLTAVGVHLEYDEQAVIYDEKVSKAEAFTKQRSRWIAAQFRYFGRFFQKGVKSLRRGNFDFFNKTMQMALPPRLLLPVFLLIGVLFNWAVGSVWVWPWLAVFSLNAMSWLLAMPRYCFQRENIIMWTHLPTIVLATLLAMRHLREANKRFIHTVHES